MQPDDLHARLVAALQARLEVARAAADAEAYITLTLKATHLDGDEGARALVEHHRHHLPATEIRRVEALLRVVKRHAHTQHRVWGPKHDPDTGELRDAEVDTECVVCGYVDGTCPTIRDLAAGEGIEVGG